MHLARMRQFGAILFFLRTPAHLIYIYIAVKVSVLLSTYLSFVNYALLFMKNYWNIKQGRGLGIKTGTFVLCLANFQPHEDRTRRNGSSKTYIRGCVNWSKCDLFSFLTLWMQSIFHSIFCKSSLFLSKIFYICNLDLRWGPTFGDASSGSKFLAKVSIGLQIRKYLLARYTVLSDFKEQ